MESRLVRKSLDFIPDRLDTEVLYRTSQSDPTVQLGRPSHIPPPPGRRNWNSRPGGAPDPLPAFAEEEAEENPLQPGGFTPGGEPELDQVSQLLHQFHMQQPAQRQPYGAGEDGEAASPVRKRRPMRAVGREGELLPRTLYRAPSDESSSYGGEGQAPRRRPPQQQPPAQGRRAGQMLPTGAARGASGAGRVRGGAGQPQGRWKL